MTYRSRSRWGAHRYLGRDQVGYSPHNWEPHIILTYMQYIYQMSASCQEERDCNSALDPGAVRKLSSVTVKSGPLTSVELDTHTLGVCSSSNTIFRHSVRSSWVHGHSTKHTTRYIPGNAMCVQNFDDSEIVQFILHIAFRCVLHRCRSQEIHC